MPTPSELAEEGRDVAMASVIISRVATRHHAVMTYKGLELLVHAQKHLLERIEELRDIADLEFLYKYS